MVLSTYVAVCRRRFIVRFGHARHRGLAWPIQASSWALGSGLGVARADRDGTYAGTA